MAQWVARYRASGQSLRAFARQHRLAPSRLHYWVYQKPRSTTSAQSLAPVRFREVRLAACLPPANPWGAELSLSPGVQVRFNAAAAPDWVAGVVAALQRLC